MTTSPTKNGSDPTTSPQVTISPHIAMINGFAVAARTDVATAVPIPTLRSSSKGNDTTLIARTKPANTKPTPVPTAIMVQPALVVNTSRMNASADTGGTGPSVSPTESQNH